jgi:L-ascorbate metabolism protein UlaG (beta-lactamase superfamily)
MKIKWLGHSSFLVTSGSGFRIVLDPYQPGGFDGAIRYGNFGEPADVVVMSHEHADHNFAGFVSGQPLVIKGSGDYVADGIEFNGVSTFHDKSGGSERGRNTVFQFVVDGISVCHLGDLGHVLTNDQASEIGKVDVLLAPVGGYFTIGPDEAWKVADQLAAKIVIPMHFKTEKVDFPIGPVDDFIKAKPNVRRLDVSEIELRPEDLPSEREIIVLRPAL